VDRGLALVAIEMWPYTGPGATLPPFEKTVDNSLRVGAILGRERNLHTIARREDNCFHNTLAGLQILQRLRQRLRTESQLLAYFDRGRLVTHAGDEQLHGLKRIEPSLACAAQVIAENPSTATVRIAALRPRQPAVVRRHTSARYT